MSEVINMLKEMCAKKLKSARELGNQNEAIKFITIGEILENNESVKLEPDVWLNILSDLGFSNFEAVKIYTQILKSEH